MHPRRVASPTQSLLLILTVSLATSCGYVGVELISEDAGEPTTDSGPEPLPDAAMMVNAAPLDPGSIDFCLGTRCASNVDRCPDQSRDWGGICGCSGSDVDSDRDGTPDCVDRCPDAPDRTAGGVCGCAAAMQDSDGDGVANCNDLCTNDAQKTLPGVCGCGIRDVDSDGDKMPDCADRCPSDAAKVDAGSCGCGNLETDSDGDGMPDCVDVCSGLNDASYVSIDTCGVGYCLTNNTPSSCVAGLEMSCLPGNPRSADDATCDGIDDNCNGATDENYPVVAQCGVGYCRSTSTASRCVGGVQTNCAPGVRRSATDTTCDGVDDNCNGTVDEGYVVNSTCGVGYCRTNNMASRCTAGVETMCQAATRLSTTDLTPDGVDDDCDGLIDEDACIPHTDTFAYRSALFAITPPAGCTHANVKLWGGAGASGSNDGGAWGAGITGGAGGAGGYVQENLTVARTAMLQLYMGQGGQGCAGGSSGSTTYRGGVGGTGNGGDASAGANGSVVGGTGNNPGSGGRGGAGSFGGGGGGAGAKLYTSSGAGGDGGGATVLLIGGTRTLTAGGGAGGGGAGSTFVASGASGGAGGAGCTGNGVSASSEGGGGGGGGVCQGATQQRGTGRTPFNGAGDLATGAALGGAQATECGNGGSGYATISWTP